jgi:hypothetical protein
LVMLAAVESTITDLTDGQDKIYSTFKRLELSNLQSY